MSSSMILLVASICGYLFRPRLAIAYSCPKHWMRSQSRVIMLEITNLSRRGVYDLQLNLLPNSENWDIVETGETVRVLLPGQTTKMPCTLKPLRRGEMELPRLQATTHFPLQLVCRSETYPLPRKALILPFFHELRTFELAQAVPSIARGNTLALQTVGLTGEYVGSREYQPGIPVRKWDYSSWARLGQPVVREFSEPRHPSAAVILDTFFPAPTSESTQPIPELEAILSLAAAITGALIGRGNRIDFLSIGNRVVTGHDRESGENHLAILEHMALAQPCHTDDIAGLIHAIERTTGTWDLAIVVSHRWGAEQERLLQTATKRYVTGARILVEVDDRLGDAPTQNLSYSVLCSQIESGTVDL